MTSISREDFIIFTGGLTLKLSKGFLTSERVFTAGLEGAGWFGAGRGWVMIVLLFEEISLFTGIVSLDAAFSARAAVE